MTRQPISLKETIQAEAGRLGFALAGVTSPEPPGHWPEFENWLARGRHGSMSYLTDPRRADPRRVLPECESILVLAARYPNPGPMSHSSPPANRGRVAAYAWGRDYHLVLPERLHALADFIQSQVGRSVPSLVYTDTGPLLERDLAQRAGLGWIGKNTCLIHPQIGSYFFLAEILLGIELAPDHPFGFDRCGRCQRCLDACPTGCILPDRTIDARRCISYLTIENKGEIPVALRARLGSWIFGCDVCQQVCPWNGRPGSLPLPQLAAPAAAPVPELIAEVNLSSQEFNRCYRHTALARARRKGYRRNVIVALGNVGDRRAVPALEQACGENTPLVSNHAAWALDAILRK
jgi:epoxyqueuosine reductase